VKCSVMSPFTKQIVQEETAGLISGTELVTGSIMISLRGVLTLGFTCSLRRI